MDVFISWSGKKSKDVAELIKEWLRCVIQATRPWISSSDIEPGSFWSKEIQEKLDKTSFGIVCLTKENLNKPWILFESGALAKGINASRLFTLLIDLTHTDIEPPLSQFQHTSLDRESLQKLMSTINNHLKDHKLDDKVFKDAFDAHWDRNNKNLQAILTKHPETDDGGMRSDSEILAEILENTRSTQARLVTLQTSFEQGVRLRRHIIRQENPLLTLMKDTVENTDA